MNNNLFYIDEEKKYAVLLGYVMPLTATEFAVLRIISEGEDYVGAEDIALRVFAGKTLTSGNVAVHVCNINKKAKTIGGRRLIAWRRYKGYKLSEKI